MHCTSKKQYSKCDNFLYRATMQFITWVKAKFHYVIWFEPASNQLRTR